MTLTFVVTVLLFAVVIMPGCNNSPNSTKEMSIPRELEIPKNFDYGRWNGSTYRNDYFGFSITKPNEWAFAGDEELKAIDQDGAEIINSLRGDKKIVSEQDINLVEVMTANLFLITRYSDEEDLDVEDFNPNIILKVQKNSIPGRDVVLDQTEYVKAIRQGLSNVPGCVIKSQTNKTIGGQEFTSLQGQLTFMDFVFSQEMLICFRNGYVMLFALTSFDDSEKIQLDDIMATLKWD